MAIDRESLDGYDAGPWSEDLPLGDGDVGDGSDDRALELDRLITAYFELQREGRAPDAEEYISAYPEHEHALRAVLPGASLLDQLGKRAEDAAPFSRSGERLGEFKLLGILGRGGMGVVYEAVQEALDRPVALKVLPASRVIDRKSRERFMREAQAAASLQHPGIVPVYGVGEADGQVYYAMQRIDGVPLDVLIAAARGEELETSESTVQLERAAGLAARLRFSAFGTVGGSKSGAHPVGADSSSIGAQVRTPRTWIDNAVHVVLQAAEALSYAHSRGVLHRDVKPSNLMLDDDGRVYVTDFGLCKTSDNSSLTAAGDVVGTLRYVPPERFQGRDDARGDVYGLGMILYELLCGRPAFPQRNRAELVQAVTLQAPARPRRLNPEIPEDLETIVLTATAQLPEERYPSMEALIADLDALRRGRPIQARAPGKLYLIRLFARRNRALVGTVLAAAALLLAGAVLYVINLRGLVRELRDAQELAQQSTYHAEIGAAAGAIVGNQESLARRHLDAVPSSARDWLWRTMEARLRTAERVVDGGMSEVLTGALGAGDSLIALVRAEGVRVCEVATGAVVADLAVENVTRVAFLPGGRALVLVQGPESMPVAMPLDPGDPVATGDVAWFQERVRELDLRQVEDMDASDGHLALACVSGTVVVVGTRESGDVRAYPCVPGSPALVAVFGDDGRAVHAARGDRVTVCGPGPGRKRVAEIPQRGPLLDLVGAREVNRFAILSPRGQVYGYEDDDRPGILEPRPPIAVASNTFVLAIHPAGDELLASARNGTVRRWTSERGVTVDRARTLRSGPTVLLWPRGGDTLIAAGASGDWRVIPIPTYSSGLPGISRSRSQYTHCRALGVDRGGEHYAVADLMGAWAVWSLERRLPVAADVDGLRRVESVALDTAPGGAAWLALGGDGLRVVRWEDLGSGQWTEEELEGVRDVLATAWTGLEPGRELLAVERSGRLIRARERPGGWTVEVLASAGEEIVCAALGDRLEAVALGTAAAAVLWFDPGRGAFRSVVELGAVPLALAFDRRGEHVAVTDLDQVLRAYRRRGARFEQLPWEAQVAEVGQHRQGDTALAVDADQGWILTGSSDGACRTFALESGRPGPELLNIHGGLTDIRFPRPGAPPIALEWRGRVNHFELDGVDRTGGVPGLEPTPAEARALATTSALERLRTVERQLARTDLTLEQARMLEGISSGLYFYARYNPREVPPPAARAALLRANELLNDLEVGTGP